MDSGSASFIILERPAYQGLGNERYVNDKISPECCHVPIESQQQELLVL